MKILILTHYFPPLHTIASHRPYGWARAWADAGHDVHVLTPEKYAFDGALGLDLNCDGITVHRVAYPAGLVSGRPPAGVADASHARWVSFKRLTRRVRDRCRLLADPRLLSVPALVAGARTAARDGPFDLLVSTYAPASAHIAANRIAAATGVRWVADYQDLWTGNFARPRPWLGGHVQGWCERRVMRSASMIVTLSEGVAGRLRLLLGRDCHVARFGYTETDAAPIRADDGRLHLVYTGRVYPRFQPADTFFAALAGALRQRPDLGDRLRVDFYGAEQQDLQRLCVRYGTAPVTRFHGEVPHHAARGLQRGADAALFFDWSDARSPGVLTGKLFEYLWSGRPIVAVSAIEAEAGGLIRACRAGAILSSQDSVRRFLVGLPASLPAREACDAAIAGLSSRQQGLDILATIQRELF